MNQPIGTPLLDIRGLRIAFGDRPSDEVVHGIDLAVHRGQVMGLVGESGSGKSVTARAVIGLLRPPGRVTGGSIAFDGQELVGATERTLRRLRGKRIGMVYQDPLSALNPSMRVGAQIAEALTAHGWSRGAAAKHAVELLDLVGIPAARERASSYPHEFSGGMRQRVVIASALANSPALLIADEPTTALDVTVQAQILRLLRDLRDELDIATLFITHDLGIVAELCDDVTVMLAGEVVERGATDRTLARPTAPYTRRLLAAVPRLDGPLATPSTSGTSAERLRVSELRVDVGRRRHPILAVDGVSLHIDQGETLGLVGESGCGKSTLSRAIAGLIPVASGSVALGDDELASLPTGAPGRRSIQYVFQDPYSALDPLRTVRQSIEEARSGADGAGESAATLLERVGLDRALLDRYPSAFSGGQRQRIGIARALAANPRFLLSDEPVSALDVSIQAQVIELMDELRRELGIGNLFIAHDLAVVRRISQRVAVMFLGRIVETGSAAEVYAAPRHPYTVALLSAVPEPTVGAAREHILLQGDPPSPANPPRGCRFASRCPVGPKRFPERTACLEIEPVLAGDGDHTVACHFPGSLELPRPIPGAA